MLKQLAALILLLAFATQTFSNPLIMLGYYTNQAAYAKNCINKARPKLHCNGKCQMMKKMQQQESKDQQTPGSKYENKVEDLSASSYFAALQLPGHIIVKLGLPASDRLPQSCCQSVFHPPQA